MFKMGRQEESGGNSGKTDSGTRRSSHLPTEVC